MTIKQQLITAWIAYINEFGVRETFTLLQLEHAIKLSHRGKT